jgi:hypothetical protein
MTRDSFDDVFGKHFAPATQKPIDSYVGSKKHFVDLAKSFRYWNQRGCDAPSPGEARKCWDEQDKIDDHIHKHFNVQHGHIGTSIVDAEDHELEGVYDRHIKPKVNESDEEEIQDIKQFLRTTKRTLYQKWNTMRGRETKRLSVNKWHSDNPDLHHLSGEQALPVFRAHVHDAYKKHLDSNMQNHFVKHWNRLRTGKTTSVPITKGE